MSILGLTDPWIIAAYAGCIISVVICIYVSLRKTSESEESEQDD